MIYFVFFFWNPATFVQNIFSKITQKLRDDRLKWCSLYSFFESCVIIEWPKSSKYFVWGFLYVYMYIIYPFKRHESVSMSLVVSTRMRLWHDAAARYAQGAHVTYAPNATRHCHCHHRDTDVTSLSGPWNATGVLRVFLLPFVDMRSVIPRSGATSIWQRRAWRPRKDLVP